MNFLDVESEVPNPQLQVVVVLVMFTWEQGHGGHLDTSSVIAAAILTWPPPMVVPIHHPDHLPHHHG